MMREGRENLMPHWLRMAAKMRVVCRNTTRNFISRAMVAQ